MMNSTHTDHPTLYEIRIITTDDELIVNRHISSYTVTEKQKGSIFLVMKLSEHTSFYFPMNRIYNITIKSESSGDIMASINPQRKGECLNG
jgi:hypothetical protein